MPRESTLPLAVVFLVLLFEQLRNALTTSRQYFTFSTHSNSCYSTITTKERTLVANENSINLHHSLKYLHIPKTGGSMIEQVAASAGYSWGYCMFQDGSSRNDDCPRNSEALRLNEFPTSNLWHLPIQHLPGKARYLYENASIFTVVRNPYSRVLSEYYYRCAFHKRCNDKINDAQHMNSWITTAINSVMESKIVTCSREVIGYHNITSFLITRVSNTWTMFSTPKLSKEILNVFSLLIK